jgi:hypothetical protein
MRPTRHISTQDENLILVHFGFTRNARSSKFALLVAVSTVGAAEEVFCPVNESLVCVLFGQLHPAFLAIQRLVTFLIASLRSGTPTKATLPSIIVVGTLKMFSSETNFSPKGLATSTSS